MLLVLAQSGDPNRDATLGFFAPQSFFGFSNYIKSTLVERAKSDKSDTGQGIKLQPNVTLLS